MTVLSPATERSQRDSGDYDSWEECGETCASVCLNDCGHPGSTIDVAAYLRSVYGEGGVSAGTDGDELVNSCQHFGGSAHTVAGDTRSTVDEALARRHRVIWAIWSDGLGNPNGSRHTGHWVVIWGRDDVAYHVMNPLGSPIFGQNHAYPLSDIEGNSQDSGIEIDEVVPADRPAVPMSVITEDDDT